MNEQPSAQDLLRTFLSQPVDARLGLFAGDALYREGLAEEAVAVWALSDDADPRLRRIKDAPHAPARVRAVSARADAAFRQHFTNLHVAAVAAFEERTGSDARRVRNAIWPMTHEGAFEWRRPQQQPAIFYMPDLPARPITPSDGLPWAAALETAWREIREEYRAAVARQLAMEPYVRAGTPGPQWSALRGTLDWSSIHLCKESMRTAHTAQFPATLGAVEQADLVRVGGVPMEIFFSRLRPGAHIPPHFGLTNARLTMHLPLIVPTNCAIRVASDVHHWREGRLIAFDDSFEHEAWNRSDSDRVVLIFEVHHPDLSAAERTAIEHAYAVRDAWLANRRRLLERRLAI